jgi:transcriptional regulator with XRE-family HTH domain
MNFWQIVIDELEYQGKTRKWLAAEVGIDVSTIGTGLKRGSIPQVDVALKIATALDVGVEYLVTGKKTFNKENKIQEDLHKYHKYAKTIEQLDSLPDRERIPIIAMIEEMNLME